MHELIFVIVEKSTAGVVMADSAVRVHEKADTVVFYATVNGKGQWKTFN